mmetsp:Transcript_4032/g.9925  ORF Transcript_4032/g.9925 Transcript_4032/m.9925 type:complete len:204 (+) Transcript_4032:921-1532(+)
MRKIKYLIITELEKSDAVAKPWKRDRNLIMVGSRATRMLTSREGMMPSSRPASKGFSRARSSSQPSTGVCSHADSVLSAATAMIRADQKMTRSRSPPHMGTVVVIRVQILWPRFSQRMSSSKGAMWARYLYGFSWIRDCAAAVASWGVLKMTNAVRVCFGGSFLTFRATAPRMVPMTPSLEYEMLLSNALRRSASVWSTWREK